MNSALLKTELRKQVNGEIAALPDAYITDSDKSLFQKVTSIREFIDARNIMIFCSVKREPDTIEIAKSALLMGKKVTFPRCVGDGIMHARAVECLSELEPGMLDIPAPPESAPIVVPEELDLIVVPALTFDIRGHRLGYGGGYYDRYLSGIRAYTIGMAREQLIKRSLPNEPHDIAVKCIVTESEIRS